VVFDENVFPFAELHPNAGHHLKQDILLLPDYTPDYGDANINDYMPLPVVPIVTNNDGDAADTHNAPDMIIEPESGRNSAPDGQETEENCRAHNAMGSDPEADLPDPTGADPGVDPPRSDREGPPAAASDAVSADRG
jgi:hypothetical protein